jgi:hypothetical protein
MTSMQESSVHRIYFRALAVFYLVFGLITTFYPRLMHLFMTQRGIDASTSFSTNVWLHDGLDIISVAILLFALSTLSPSRLVLAAAAVVALLPVVAILYSLAATSFWSPLFLVPATAASAFAVWGFALAGRLIPEEPEQRSSS